MALPAAPAAPQPHSVMPVAAPGIAPVAHPQIKSVVAPKAAPAPQKQTRVAAARTEAPQAPAPAAKGAKALAAAKQQLGVPYEWGGTTPSGFDCSGLMQWAFDKVGIDLPRTSKAQSQEGQKVSLDNLQPGDLIFFHSPVSHVGMYAGNGKMIEAPTEGQDVKMSDLSRRMDDAVGARRMV